MQFWAGFSPRVDLAPCCLGGSLGRAGASLELTTVLGFCTPLVGCEPTASNRVKDLNRGVLEEASSGRTGISRATVEPVRFQLVRNTFDFCSASEELADAPLGRGAEMQGMFAISFLCLMNLHGALESANKSM